MGDLIAGFLVYFDGVGLEIDPVAKVSTFQLGLTDLKVIDSNTLEVELRRPGLLIGKGGKDLDKLEKYLECNIQIKEKRF